VGRRARGRTSGRTLVAVVLAVALSALGLVVAFPAAANPSGPGALNGHRHARVCGAPLPHHAACHAVVDLDVSGPLATAASTPLGYGPGDLQTAYNLPSSTAGLGRTVAVVAAFDLPTAQNDLNVYRAQYGLPACGSGCFTKVDQNGGNTLPAVNPSWGQEIALDLDMVSAACPLCNILLVEANSTSLNDLGTAVNTAVRMGAVAVSNSYGGPEFTGQTNYDATYFDHPGVAITASSGDSGYGVSYPAASKDVIAVGGTTLTPAATARGFSEGAWGGSGSGCSAFEPKPLWQRDPACPRRTVADVAAVADPATGVAVYDSTPNNGQSGWLVFGGTSVSAPLVAATYAMAGTPAAGSNPASFPYAPASALNDVTSGSNGTCGSYLCTSGPGYDGPTGLGTPNGTGAFTASASPGGFVATRPSRILDTRSGTGAAAAPVGPGGTVTLTVPNLPPGTTGVVLNLTATQLRGTTTTYVSACPAAQPLTSCAQTSVLNPNPGVDIANELTVPVAADGKIRLYNNTGSIDLVADLAGYLTTAFIATGPSRVLDTRDGTGAAAAPVVPGGTVTLTVPNLPPGTTGVVLNLTATQLRGTTTTYVSACPAAQPLTSCAQTSVLNPNPGVDIANELTVPVAADGKIRLYNNTGSIDLVADLAGYLTTAFIATGPSRVLDTRDGTGAAAAPVVPGGTVTLTVPNLPPGTTGVVLNLTATQLRGTTTTYVSACPAAQPLTSCAQTSVLNPNPGVDIANELTVPVAADGKIRLYNNTGSIDLVADLAGYLTSG